MAHPPLKMNVTPEWTLAHEEPDNGTFSVGGLAYDLGMLNGQAQVEPARFSLAKFVELSRRERRLSTEELAKLADIDLLDLVLIERANARIRDPQIIVKLAATLGVSPQPLLELGGFVATLDEHLGHLATQFAARTEPVRALEPEEAKALQWFKQEVFG
ncbi:MAG TPA: XRE family transcriptional regulator [Phycisphaerae bacterium]|jgi:hypothetical protein